MNRYAFSKWTPTPLTPKSICKRKPADQKSYITEIACAEFTEVLQCPAYNNLYKSEIYKVKFTKI